MTSAEATLSAQDAHVECGVCVHDAFDRQAALTPDAVAVLGDERPISYIELQRRAERLAFTLRRAGVGPEVPVLLHSERSLDAVVGILGVLKAGGAYVPINPCDPEERVSEIIEDAGVSLVLSQSHLRERLRVPASNVIELSDGRIQYGSLRTEGTVPSGTTQDNLAAIVYTSGSTGIPKGVEIRHSAIMARIRNGYRPRRHDLQKAPLSVVAHFSDLILPLLSGGPVIFIPDACLRSGRALLDVIQRYGTTRMVFVPSQLSVLLEGDSDTVAALGRLDSVIVSGESLNPTLVRDFKRLLPHTVLLNAYGASEVAGLACMGAVSSPDDITVGNAIPGCAVYVLDDDLRPARAGALGEVYLGGPQLARGYRRNPSLTGERFVVDPSSEAGSLMYQTGDLAERLPDGRIRIVGRRDLEVKVHGLRVNLNEVEAVLERTPGVRRAVVAFDGADVHERLTAYVLAQEWFDAGDLTSLRAAVAAQLPSYMVPSRIRIVTAFPMLANGKVDRVALRLVDSEAFRSEESVTANYLAPRTVTERALANIWQDLLGISRVSATDDFFALGGDSLDATRFTFRAEAVGLRVTLQQLEDAPSLEALARTIDEEAGRHAGGLATEESPQ